MVGSPRALALLGAVVVLALAGCASPAPAAPPSRSPAPAVEETPSTPPDPLSTVARVVIRPTALELRDAAGAIVQALDYMSDPVSAVSVLARVLGASPVDEPYEGSNHYPPGVLHTWGGLSLDERHYPEAERVSKGLDSLVWPRFAVLVTGPTAGSVPVATAQGLQAGGTWDALAADPGYDPGIPTCAGTSIDAVEVTIPGIGATHVAVTAVEADDGTIGTFLAPQLESEGCA